MVPPNDSTDISLKEERVIRSKVLHGLKLAVDDELGADSRKLTATEREKFTYFVIRDLDLPLTYSWYLAGAFMHADPSSQSPADDRSGEQEYGGLHADTQTDSDVQRYRRYFRETEFIEGYHLQQIVYTKQADFLCDFYEKCAPEEYTDLYIHSTELRAELKRLDEYVERDSTNASLSDFGSGIDDGLLSRHREERIRRLVSHLHIDLAQLDGFEKTRGPVSAGTDVIENVLTKLTHLSSINEDQKNLVTTLDDFFYNTVWKFPALKISAETATGPNGGQLETRHSRRFDSFENILPKRANRVANKHRDAGLEPTIEEFTANEEAEDMQFVHELTNDVVDSQ